MGFMHDDAIGGVSSAVNLKFLPGLLQSHHRNFKFKNRAGNINLLVPFAFRSSFANMRSRITNFGKRVLVKV
jgi:hypothetical protein